MNSPTSSWWLRQENQQPTPLHIPNCARFSVAYLLPTNSCFHFWSLRLPRDIAFCQLFFLVLLWNITHTESAYSWHELLFDEHLQSKQPHNGHTVEDTEAYQAPNFLLRSIARPGANPCPGIFSNHTRAF